jgi:uncharacterized protein (DUF952 family)
VLIYHIALVDDWAGAAADGAYRVSTRGRTLDDEGFLHASMPHQVSRVADLFYRDLDDDALTVLVIDTDRLHADVRHEDVPGWNDPLPHIYGPLNVDAVVRTLPVRRDSSGAYTFTP